MASFRALVLAQSEDDAEQLAWEQFSPGDFSNTGTETSLIDKEALEMERIFADLVIEP